MSSPFELIPLGEWVEGYGEVEMVGLTGGERYYWLNNEGVITMIPAFMIEEDYWMAAPANRNEGEG